MQGTLPPSVRDEDGSLAVARRQIVDRVGEPPLAEFRKNHLLSRYCLHFNSGKVVLDRHEEKPVWTVVEDTTPTQGCRPTSRRPEPKVTSGPSSSTPQQRPSSSRSYSEAMEEVNGPEAERTMRRKIGNFASRRGGVMTEARRVQFNDGSCITFVRHPGQASWMQISDP